MQRHVSQAGEESVEVWGHLVQSTLRSLKTPILIIYEKVFVLCLTKNALDVQSHCRKHAFLWQNRAGPAYDGGRAENMCVSKCPEP